MSLSCLFFKLVGTQSIEYKYRYKPFIVYFSFPDSKFESLILRYHRILGLMPAFLCAVSSHPFVSGISCSSHLTPPHFGGCCLCQLLWVVPHNRASVQLIFYLLRHPLSIPHSSPLLNDPTPAFLFTSCMHNPSSRSPATVIATHTVFLAN